MDTVNTTTEKETAMTTMTTTAAGLRAAADNLRECAAELDRQAQIAADAEFAAQLAEAKTEDRVLTNRGIWKNIAVGDVVAMINYDGMNDPYDGMNDPYVTVEKVTAITETGHLTLRVTTEWWFARVNTKGTSSYNVGLYDMVTKIN